MWLCNICWYVCWVFSSEKIKCFCCWNILSFQTLMTLSLFIALWIPWLSYVDCNYFSWFFSSEKNKYFWCWHIVSSPTLMTLNLFIALWIPLLPMLTVDIFVDFFFWKKQILLMLKHSIISNSNDIKLVHCPLNSFIFSFQSCWHSK